MGAKGSTPKLNRRSFLKTSAAAGSAILAAGLPSTPRALAADGYDHRNERPGRMQYRKLGRTNFMCSALVFGCGAALRDGKAIRLLERAYDQGVNHFDVGRTYKGSEAAMAPFLKQHRGDIWVTSKAPARTGEALGPDDPLTVDYAKGAMRYWTQQLDGSLKALDTDYVDAYYLMGVNHAGFVKSEETATAFLKAKEAGKVGHFGISTHERAQECLEAAIEAGWYSLAMIAMTPSGWYDYRDRQLRKGTLNLKQVRPLLDQAREAVAAGADLLLLDNRSPEEIREIAGAMPEGLLLEASGGISLYNVRAYAEAGVHRISIGALTHSAKVADVALEMESGGESAPRDPPSHG